MRIFLGPVAVLALVLLLGCGQGGRDNARIPPLSENVRISLTSVSGTGFCCDPNAEFPQDIGTLTIANDYPDLPIIVVIEPFTPVPIHLAPPSAIDGLVNLYDILEPAGVLEVKLKAIRCDWITAEGYLRISVGFAPSTENGTKLEMKIDLRNDCPHARIRTGVEIAGLAGAYFHGPAPTGLDPWLYVIGTNDGVEAYALQKNPDGRITATPRVNSPAPLVPWIAVKRLIWIESFL